MKKTVHFISAILLLASMLVCMTACGAPNLTGEWTAQVDPTEFILEDIDLSEMTSEIGIDTTDILDLADLKFDPLPLTLTLKEDGSFTYAMDQAWADSAMTEIIDWLLADFDAIVLRMLESEFADKDISLDQVMELFGVEDVSELFDVIGLSEEAVRKEFMKATDNIFTEEELADFTYEGTWKYEKGSVILEGDDEEIVILYNAKDDTLLSDDEDFGEIIFTRVQ